MKKFLLLIALAMTFIVAQAQAQTLRYELGDVRYILILDDHTAYVNSLSTSGQAKTSISTLTIKGELNVNGETYEVKRIKDEAFKDVKTINTVVIEKGVNKIGENAFANSSISEISFPKSLFSCYDNAFEGCKNFKAFHVDPDNQTYSSYNGILYSVDLRILQIYPPGIHYTSISEDNNTVWAPQLDFIGSAFITCDNLSAVYVPYGVKIVDQPFVNCANLNTVAIPSSVTSFNNLFPVYKCPKLVLLSLNVKNVPLIDRRSGDTTPCINLYVRKGLKSSYEGYTPWKNFQKIVDGAFDFTTSDFDGERVMYSMMSDKPEVIHGKQYDGRLQLVFANTNNYAANKKFIISDYIENAGKSKKYAITSIGYDVFESMQTQPFSLTLGENIDSIYNDAFSLTCRGTLTQLNLNTNLKFVGIRAFENCGISNNLIFSYGIETIEEKAFDSNKIQAMMIPGTIKSIGREAFYNNPMKWISLNTSVPFKTYFTNSSSCKLYVPTGAVNQYKNNSYYSTYTISAGACDFTYNNAGLLNTRYHTTILSNEPVTYDGVTYAGTAKYVYSPANAPGVLSTTTFDGGIASTCKVNGVNKDYLIVEYGDSCLYGATDIVTLPLQNSKAVKRIGKYAFQGTNIASVTMPESLETIDDYAFRNCTKLTQFTLNANLKNLNKGALSGSAVKNGLMFHYGIENIGEEAFKNSAIPSLFIPATIKTLGKTAFDGLTKLKYLSINSERLYKTEPTMLNVPSTCKFYVPTGVTKQYKNAAGWKGLTVSAGASDFTYKNAGILNTRYHYTITLDYPITYEGETYDGWVKVVYSPANDPGVLSTTTFDPGLYAEYNLYGVNKKYLIHELGDSCLYGASDIVSLPLENSPYLSVIGKKAFSGTSITEVTLPDVSVIGTDAFYSCKQLKEIIVPAVHEIGSLWDAGKWDNRWYGNNAPDFKCYVQWDRLTPSRKRVLSKWELYRGETEHPASKLRAYYKRQGELMETFSVEQAVDWKKTEDITAFVIDEYNEYASTSKWVVARYVNTSASGEGLIITTGKKDKIYKLEEPEVIPDKVAGNYLVGTWAGEVTLDGTDETDGTKYAVNLTSGAQSLNRITESAYKVPAGRAYFSGKMKTDIIKIGFKLPGMPGDVNGDYVVDVADANAVINMILGLQTCTDSADVNGDGTVDVADMNALINLILGIE